MCTRSTRRWLAVLPACATLLAASGASAPAASATVCYDRGYEDLIAENIRCGTAARVYRRSLKVAAADGGSRTRFKLAGLRWTCRAYNPPAVEFYTWRCTAAKGRLSQYRWKSGE